MALSQMLTVARRRTTTCLRPAALLLMAAATLHGQPAAEAGQPACVRSIVGRSAAGTSIEAWLDTSAVSLSGKADVRHIAVVFQQQALATLAGAAPEGGEVAAAYGRLKARLLPALAPQRTRPALTLASFPESTLHGFPPAGDAYRGDDALRHAIWRWLPLQGVDLLIVVREREQGASVIRCTKSSYDTIRSLVPADTPIQVDPPADDALWSAASRQAMGQVGAIPAMALEISDLPAALPDLLTGLRLQRLKPSAATSECVARLQRDGETMLQQLSRHYGREPRLHYIPALACVARLKHEAKHGGREFHQQVEEWIAASPGQAPRNGSEIAGRLLLAQWLRLSAPNQRGRAAALQMIRETAALAFDNDGRMRPAMPHHAEMSDAVFMAGPLLAEAGDLLQDARYFDACLRHVRFMQELCLRDDGLYRHHPGNEAAWGRGNGFPAMGIAWSLTRVDPDHPAFEPLRSSLLSHLRALKKRQAADGCWKQIIDRPDAYRELTSTCMILFAMRRAVRLGWASETEFGEAIERAWRAVRLRTSRDKRLVDVCTGTGKQSQFNDYYARTAILGPDDRGGAMVMTASWEMQLKR